MRLVLLALALTACKPAPTITLHVDDIASNAIIPTDTATETRAAWLALGVERADVVGEGGRRTVHLYGPSDRIGTLRLHDREDGYSARLRLEYIETSEYLNATLNYNKRTGEHETDASELAVRLIVCLHTLVFEGVPWTATTAQKPPRRADALLCSSGREVIRTAFAQLKALCCLDARLATGAACSNALCIGCHRHLACDAACKLGGALFCACTDVGYPCVLC